MRASEFIVEYKQYPLEEFEGINMKLKVDNHELILQALDDWGNKVLGHVRMNIGDGSELDPQDLQVDERYRGQGIARVMYDYLKSKGYEIHRSPDQTDDGKHFWDKNRGEEGNVWEDVFGSKAPKQFEPLKEFEENNLKLEPEPYEGWTGEGIIVRAYLSDKEVGHVIFEPTEDDETQWYAVDVEVDDNYQRKGIATSMYNLAKNIAKKRGIIIVRSHAQSQAGQGLWQDKKVWEDVPKPGPSSGAPKQFGPDAKIETRQMTVKQLISSVPGLPYYNNVVDDWDAKDYSWGVTKKVIEYATYLKEHPESLSKLPPIIVLNGKFEDGAHRVSAIWLLQQRMDPKNPLWSNAKLNVQFVTQNINESFLILVRKMVSLVRNTQMNNDKEKEPKNFYFLK